MNSLNAFDKIFQFEQALAKFTGAPHAIMTDCCTHAIEMCLRYDKIRSCSFTAYTYLSLPMTMHKLGIRYTLEDEQWTGEYRLHDTRIWDSARRLEEGMYRKGMMQCLSFGHDKPLHIGRGGAILLDDEQAYNDIILMRYDGRNLNTRPWTEQKQFRVGYHYKPIPEEAVQGLALLEGIKFDKPAPKHVNYADLRQFTIME
jgi:dTDP-4-amino-4,6-dideoxygalactose transaminase